MTRCRLHRIGKSKGLNVAIMLCTVLAGSCHAMLVTPAPSDSTFEVFDLSAKRQSFFINPEYVPIVKRRSHSAQVETLNALKSGVNPSAVELAKIDAQNAESNRPLVSVSWAAVALTSLVVILAALVAVVIWLSRRAQAIRERERLAMLKGVLYLMRLNDPNPKVAAFTLKEFLALCAHFENKYGTGKKAPTSDANVSK